MQTATKTTMWAGVRKPTLRMTPSQVAGAQMLGIADLTIDGREVRCTIMARRGQTFARSVAGEKWFQLIRS